MEKKLMTFSNFWVKFVLIWDIKFHLHSNVKYTLKCILYYLFIKIYNISLHWVYFSLKNSWRKFFPWNKFGSYLLVCTLSTKGQVEIKKRDENKNMKKFLFKGVAIWVPEGVPLFYSWNSDLNKEQMCLVAKDVAPYEEQNIKYLKYSICSMDNPR